MTFFGLNDVWVAYDHLQNRLSFVSTKIPAASTSGSAEDMAMIEDLKTQTPSEHRRESAFWILFGVLVFTYGPALLLTMLLLLPVILFLCTWFVFPLMLALIAKTLIAYDQRHNSGSQNRFEQQGRADMSRSLLLEIPHFNQLDQFLTKTAAVLCVSADAHWSRFQQLWRRGGSMKISVQVAVLPEAHSPTRKQNEVLQLTESVPAALPSLREPVQRSRIERHCDHLAKEGSSELSLHQLVVDNTVTNLRYLKHMLRYGADPNVFDEFGMTPLHTAAWSGNAAEAFCLLQHGANPDVRDHRGVTALHIAVWRHHVPVVSVLLRHDANPHIPCSLEEHTPSRGGWNVSLAPSASCLTPIQFAILREDKFLVHLLLTYDNLECEPAHESGSLVRSPSDPTLAQMETTARQIHQLQIKTIESAMERLCASWEQHKSRKVSPRCNTCIR